MEVSFEVSKMQNSSFKLQDQNLQNSEKKVFFNLGNESMDNYKSISPDRSSRGRSQSQKLLEDLIRDQSVKNRTPRVELKKTRN